MWEGNSLSCAIVLKCEDSDVDLIIELFPGFSVDIIIDKTEAWRNA